MCIIFDVLAVPERAPQGHSDRRIILHMILTKHFLNVDGCFLSVVEWHVGEQMMCDMSVCNVMEEIVEDGSERSVNSAKGTTEPCPLFVIEMRHIDICVLEIGDKDQMIVDY